MQKSEKFLCQILRRLTDAIHTIAIWHEFSTYDVTLLQRALVLLDDEGN